MQLWQFINYKHDYSLEQIVQYCIDLGMPFSHSMITIPNRFGYAKANAEIKNFIMTGSHPPLHDAITCEAIFSTIKTLDSLKKDQGSNIENKSSKDNKEEEKNSSYFSISRKESMSAFTQVQPKASTSQAKLCKLEDKNEESEGD